MEMSIGVLISAFFFSGLKLLFTPMALAAAYSNNFQMLFEIAIICGIGSVFSALIFFFVGKGLDKIGQQSQKKSKKINFKRNRKIIRIKERFKLFGTSMTIGIISVPLGSILVGKYFGNEKKAIPTLILASFIWSFGVTYITAFFTQFIKPLFS
ncbi:MAG: hypothetical protein CMP67_07075 [Flavobacteriales bacterium]|nr:hypothetical protein [Flavobacteriales bacterium]MBO72859.1 hypothetical protein [Flavobacteriales bacterium]|tara:strand:+ start:513 stop:974 length:462 start_codon:yes stop_codon:yes gene_type:complete